MTLTDLVRRIVLVPGSFLIALCASPPEPRAAEGTIHSAVLGEMTAKPYDVWAGATIALPLYHNERFTVQYMFDPDDDPAFLAEADKALAHFLKLDDTVRLSSSRPVGDFARINLEAWDYRGYEAKGEHAWVGLRDLSIDEAWLDDFVAGRKAPEDVWRMLGNLSEVYLARGRDNAVYVAVSWNCLWDVEHGFLMTFKEGQQLARISAHDGELTD